MEIPWRVADDGVTTAVIAGQAEAEDAVRMPMREPHQMRTALPRTATVALAAVLLAAALAACGDDGGASDGAEGDGTGTIEFWDNNGGVRTEIWQEIIADFEEICAGECDEIPEQAFYMVGDLDQVKEKAKTLA